MRIDRLAAPEFSELWSLREDVTVLFGADHLLLHTPWGDPLIAGPAPTLREALRRMLLGPVSLGNVVPGFPGYAVPEAEWNDESRHLLAALDGLQHVVVRHVAAGAPYLSVVPLTPTARFRPAAVPPGAGARLRDDVVVRLAGGEPVLESAGLDHRVELHGPEAGRLLAQLRGQDGGTAPFLPPAVARAARCYAAAAGLLTEWAGAAALSVRNRHTLLVSDEDSL
ncbi:hypothetical protein RB200_11415 [Streptomyces sp. PmtG]